MSKYILTAALLIALTSPAIADTMDTEDDWIGLYNAQACEYCADSLLSKRANETPMSAAARQALTAEGVSAGDLAWSDHLHIERQGDQLSIRDEVRHPRVVTR